VPWKWRYPASEKLEIIRLVEHDPAWDVAQCIGIELLLKDGTHPFELGVLGLGSMVGIWSGLDDTYRFTEKLFHSNRRDN
jgi:hypothetical protein